MHIKKAVVTGANGFVGSHLVKKLCENGTHVFAVIKDENEDISTITNLSNITIEYCDMSEYLSLADKIVDRDIDVFYHLSWAGTSGNARGDYNLQLQNVKACCDIVMLAKEMNIGKIVYSASIMEYECIKLFQTEKPNSSANIIYSISKLTSHYMAYSLACSCDVNFTSVVISNIYGPGEISHRLVNTTIRKLLKNEQTSFSEGEQLYDFIYINDAVDAFKIVGEKGMPNQSYYLGSQPKHLREYLLELGKVVNPQATLGIG
jgi:nucleoside-diphosphate-sugar epimerase